MRTLTELQLRIIKEEFPDINLDGDTDVERYFELRSIGRHSDALSLYSSRITKKYPDDVQRALLMRYYRQRDPRYTLLHQDNLVSLAERMVGRIHSIITFMTKDIDSVNLKDAYSVIKLAEGLLSVISNDRWQALSFAERYARYATLLSFKSREMANTAELLRLYVTETLESVEELKKEREEKIRLQRKKKLLEGSSRKTFDLSAIHFSNQEIARILIPEQITRVEDTVIAYCLKYWNLVFDGAFEKSVFLYSKKFHTRHSDIFQAIKNGISHGWKDEEILNAVLANVVSGYYYSISGDRYLQHTWARYKGSLGMPQATPQPEPSLPIAEKPQRKRTHKKVPLKKSPQTKALHRISIPAPKKQPHKAVAQTAPFSPNSITDIIKKMTGKTYTVYKDLFFQDIRPSIRAVLASAAGKKEGLFSTSKQNQAEELVYGYLFDHYSDPYQNWTNSEERKRIEIIGYPLSSIEPIIERWIKDTR